MTTINDVVTVNITSTTVQVKQTGFGTLLILDTHDKFPERIRFYTSLAGMVSDGFSSADGAYLAAQSLLSQNPQVTQFAVGRRDSATAVAMVTKIVPTSYNTTVYKVKVNGVEASFTSDANATVAEICAGLELAIDALALSGITASSTATEVLVTSSSSLSYHSVENTSARGLLAVSQTQGVGSLAADLDAIQNENNDWYGITNVSWSTAELEAIATWAEANEKLFFASSADSEILTTGTTDVAAVLSAATRARTSVWFNKNPAQFIGAAVAGKVLPASPGSITAKFKQLSGITVSDLTATESLNATNKKANTVQQVAGVAMTGEGVVSSGEFIDKVRDTDWFEARLQERIFSLLMNNPKVPFTDAGISAVEAELRAQILDGIAAGFLTGEYSISVPKAKNVPALDRAARKLTGITFTAKVAGAIHMVVISGSITV